MKSTNQTIGGREPLAGTPLRDGLLQRKCGCGQHTVAGGSCGSCKKETDRTLQRSAVNHKAESSHGNSSSTVEHGARSTGQTPNAARPFMVPPFGRDFSRIPVRHNATRAIQRKLAVSQPGDEYEVEADRVAYEVLAAPAHTAVSGARPPIQRFAGSHACESDTAPASVDHVLASSGRPLGPALQQDMEQRFGYDFSRVRVHSGASAEQSAREVNANAYTVGHNIVFGAGRFASETHEGKRLLAHELTHVVQQGGGESSAVTATLHKQPDVVQRDVGDEDEGIEFGEVPPSSTVPTPPPEFGPRTTEPGCPRVPTGLSKLRPDPPCPQNAEEIPGRHFQFCLDSDVFQDQAQVNWMRGFARSQRADATFKVHGYASTDGTQQDNLNLSCHRAKRAARELQNAGVASQQIQIVAKGETSQFGPNQADNRIALVGASAPQGQTAAPGGTPTSLREAVDNAVARIMARDYRLAADAYLSRWTCGRIPNLAEMIRRTNILIEGEDDRARISRDFVADPAQREDPRLGHPNIRGLHEIVLANEVFTEASDPTLCAAARIVDMAFHHFVAPQLGVGINDSPVHAAAIFLVELAGFPPCETPARNVPGTDIAGTPAELWWPRLTRDPLASRATGCMDQPLPGPIDTQHLPARPETPPIFTVADRRLESGQARISAQLDRSSNRLLLTPPSRAIAMDAVVTASGDPGVVSRYEVGFVNTVTADATEINYVGGQRMRREVPVPMRARSSPAANTPPWSDPTAVVTASPSGQVTTSFTMAPPTEMEFLFEDPARRGRLELDDTLAQAGNVINTAQVHTTFHAWLIARRADAPLDRFSTHFLEGHEARFAMNLDVVGEESAATYRSEIDTSNLGDSTRVQLQGSTADQIDNDMRIVEVSPPRPRGSVPNALDINAIRNRVRQVAADLAPLREALHLDGPLMVRLFFDPVSGRMILETPARPAIPARPAAPGRRAIPGRNPIPARHATIVEESPIGGEPEGVSETGREVLANEFTIRLRKELVAAPGVPNMVPTSFNAPLPSFTERQSRRGAADPFAAEHGIGLATEIREQGELTRSAQQLRTQPGIYDPTFWPEVRVELARENYCYNFTVSGLDISDQCVDRTMHTEGCVRPFTADSFSLRSEPRFVDQQLGQETFQSPVALRVVTFPMTFVLFTPSESPGGETFNHEMIHMIDSYNEVQTMKERMARRIRARLKEIRRLAAENPRLKNSLLSRRTILEIVFQENQPFQDFFQREFTGRGARMHAREAREGLPPYRTELPPSWTTFREPPLRGGTRGSFDDKPCG